MTPPPYSDFFLNSSSSVVQFETIEIYHPNFSQTYWLVRNAINGLTAYLETGASQVFQYYPLQIDPSSSFNDLDQKLQIRFGDLGEVLPLELDRMQVLPNATYPIYAGCLVGAWVDNTGQLIALPFLIGQGGQFFPPEGAYALQMGVNDTYMFDNTGDWLVTINGLSPITVASTTPPWDYVAGGLNSGFVYSPTSASAIVSYVLPNLDVLNISVGGPGVSIASGVPLCNGFGYSLESGTSADSPGSYLNTSALPPTTIKPTLTYRTFRSDDLSAPIYGPISFDVDSISFTEEGATLACSAQRLNLIETGEQYTTTRFPMLAAFV